MKRKHLLMLFCMLACFLTLGTNAKAHTATSTEWEVLRLANKERMNVGLQPYSTTDKIQKACDIRAVEVKQSFSHTRPNGTQCFTALNEQNISYWSAGENIAMNYPTAATVMTGWMNSPGHKANILGKFIHMGIGHDSSSNGIGWVQLFTGGCIPEGIKTDAAGTLTVKKGTTLESLNLTVTVSCTKDGDSYLPLIQEMTSGYDPNKLGKQTVTVSYYELTTTFTVNVVSSIPAVPAPTPSVPAKKSLSKAYVGTIASKAYTGKALKPGVKVTYGTSTLKSGTDYTVSYKNNTKAGTATVTIKGKGNYTGTITKKFKINTKSITKCSFSKVGTKKYTKKAIKPSVTVRNGSTKLAKGKDYTITYKNNKKKGTATITIKGKGNFKGSKTIKFKIK